MAFHIWIMALETFISFFFSWWKFIYQLKKLSKNIAIFFVLVWFFSFLSSYASVGISSSTFHNFLVCLLPDIIIFDLNWRILLVLDNIKLNRSSSNWTIRRFFFFSIESNISTKIVTLKDQTWVEASFQFRKIVIESLKCSTQSRPSLEANFWFSQ